ncbi:hypothetical protein BJ878DRAFT_572732 [Calycina marina]|uniref:Uncharacterized protein n=1 Tax=Calycina marina TaxID=1763456 RepID=A0A9P7Z9U8_9HELO|nr:hypothetical protein BJ878DRAFT_572732 [Calycina marina]
MEENWVADNSGILHGVELLPYGFTNIDLMKKIDWPISRAISLGAGGDEGSVWFFDEEATKEALEVFERVHRESEEKGRRVYERVAKDLYCGIEEMRALKEVVAT